VKSTASQYTVVPGEIRIALRSFAFPQSRKETPADFCVPQNDARRPLALHTRSVRGLTENTRLANLALYQLLRDLPDFHKRRQITWLLEVTARAQRKTALSVLR
jgi:hypothetical protein